MLPAMLSTAAGGCLCPRGRNFERTGLELLRCAANCLALLAVISQRPRNIQYIYLQQGSPFPQLLPGQAGGRADDGDGPDEAAFAVFYGRGHPADAEKTFLVVDSYALLATKDEILLQVIDIDNGVASKTFQIAGQEFSQFLFG